MLLVVNINGGDILKYTKKNMGGYNLHLIQTDKFKTVTIKINFRRPIKKNEITIRNVLCDMFTQSSGKYPSKRSLTIKAQDLYAADIRCSNSRYGNYINTGFCLNVLNDKYTEEGNFRDSLNFIHDIIFDPDIVNGSFNEEKLDIVKTACLNSLNSIKDNPSDYSLLRMFEEFDKSGVYSYRMMGYVDDLDKITGNKLYQYYVSMIREDLVDIFVIGNIDNDEMIKLIDETFKINTFKNYKVNYFALEKKPRMRRRFVKEEIDNTQSKLAIACRCNGLTDYERKYPLTLFNIIFGGGSDSKLFKNVREKNSLCYTINSVVNKLDNIVIIRSGIDKSNFKKAVKIIEKELLAMKNGEFDENDIKIAKEYYNTAMDEILESEDRIINNYYVMEMIGTDDIDKKRSMMSKVVKEEIVEVAKKVYMDTIFCLEGVADEES